MSQRRAISWLLLGGCVMLQACQQLPSLANRPESTALAPDPATRIGRAVSPLCATHPGLAGLAPVANGYDAFAVRAAMIAAADRSIDVQYYIWHDDPAGVLLFQALRRAAERGVRVRLLLDDNNTSPTLDRILAALDAQPNVEVRLFNPFLHRRVRALGYLTDFPRLNRRMHNKSLTVDNLVTLVGGRNIGAEYFGADAATAFIDVDVLAVGPVARDVSADFDRYWASASAYPAALILPVPAPGAPDPLASAAARAEVDAGFASPGAALERAPLVRDLLGGQARLEWTTIRTISDPPDKGLGRQADSELLLVKLGESLGQPASELQVVSPYFVPTAAGTAYFVGLARRGVKVSILTNSLAATDVAAVHSGYAKWRRDLLAAGVALHELKRRGPATESGDRGLTGSSASSLHAKTYGQDRSRIFVGSFNFDPRSASLNTEIGFVIDSPALAGALSDLAARQWGEHAYTVKLDGRGRLYWEERRGDTTVIHRREPGVGLWRRLSVRLLSWLPIERLL